MNQFQFSRRFCGRYEFAEVMAQLELLFGKWTIETAPP